MIKKYEEFINEDASTVANVGSGTAVSSSSNGSFVSAAGTSYGGGDSGSSFATNSSVSGMGPIYSAQPSSIPGDVAGSTPGSGDIGTVLKPFTKAGITMNKLKKKRKKKSNRKEAIDKYDNLYIHKNENKILDFETFNEQKIKNE